MNAFGHHFRVDNEASKEMESCNSGIALVFEVPTTNAQDISLNYKRVLKDILKLDYGGTHATIIRFDASG